jgi:hypothetical protein
VIDIAYQRKDLATAFIIGAHLTVNIKVPQLVVEISHLVFRQVKALHLLSTGVHGEDDRASFAISSRSVDVREEIWAAAAQAGVGELDAENTIPHRCNDAAESGRHASCVFLGYAGDESKVVIGSIPVSILETTAECWCLLFCLGEGREEEGGKGSDIQKDFHCVWLLCSISVSVIVSFEMSNGVFQNCEMVEECCMLHVGLLSGF